MFPQANPKNTLVLLKEMFMSPCSPKLITSATSCTRQEYMLWFNFIRGPGPWYNLAIPLFRCMVIYIMYLNQRKKYKIVARVILNHNVHTAQVISHNPFFQFLEYPLTLVGLKKQIAFKCFMVSRPLVSTLSNR